MYFQRVRESRARNLRNERPSPLRDKVLHRWALVRELNGQGLGFRLIARYFSKQLRISVSASYLRKLWDVLEPGGENGQPATVARPVCPDAGARHCHPSARAFWPAAPLRRCCHSAARAASPFPGGSLS